MSQENNPEQELTTDSVVETDVEESSVVENSVAENSAADTSLEEGDAVESDVENAELDDPSLDAYASEEHEEIVVSRPQPLEPEKLQRVIEGALLASGQPMNATKILALFEKSEAPEKEEINDAFEAIAANCEGRGFELKQVASGWRFQVREETSTWVNRLFDEKPQKYSRALLETLALIAYRQPITRGDIEEIRGVAVSSHIIKTLSERDWIKVVGHRDVPGRPSLYATTRQFLDYFNLKSLEELPSLGEISDLESLNPELELEAMPPVPVTPDLPVDVDADEDADAEQEESEGIDSEATEADVDSREMVQDDVDGVDEDSVVAEAYEQDAALDEAVEDVITLEESPESADIEATSSEEDDAPMIDDIGALDELDDATDTAAEALADETVDEAELEIQDSVTEASAEENHDDVEEGPGITYKASEGSNVSSLFDSSPEEEV